MRAFRPFHSSFVRWRTSHHISQEIKTSYITSKIMMLNSCLMARPNQPFQCAFKILPKIGHHDQIFLILTINWLCNQFFCQAAIQVASRPFYPTPMPPALRTSTLPPWCMKGGCTRAGGGQPKTALPFRNPSATAHALTTHLGGRGGSVPLGIG